ncbi:hypothetical protein DDZ18_12930 [Marinicauda salina]|uniref:Sel1 repeat family protein n=1 Tax=Marinicauda salina TaxID=2135793 RepID=A0A2U2BQN5_9PROT|nr:SEL1-like repeat protein [Marinicauda salina]PWE16323.1 hypothetical protein DDZ18_12930 [Marinicauda salina]
MVASRRTGSGGAGLLAAFVLSLAPASAQTAPELPPSLAEEIERDHTADAVEGRSLTDTAMARASAAYTAGDYDSALLHAQRASAGGEARGATLAGHIRLHGLAGEPDDEAAVRWLQRAADMGEPDALVILARLAEAGRGGLSSWQAREFLSQAAELGDPRGALEYALYIKERGDPGAASVALDWFRLAAESGLSDAYREYAIALDQWPHGPRDPARARPWYERAGRAGDAASAMEAGLMYRAGDGGPADPARGAELIQIAAELGLPEAMGRHAFLLFQGVGDAPPEPERAASWARRGAEAGDPEAQFILAYALATGDGVTRDLERAYFWVRRAGFTREEAVVDNPDRQRLQAALERALPETAVARIESEAMAAAGSF